MFNLDVEVLSRVDRERQNLALHCKPPEEIIDFVDFGKSCDFVSHLSSFIGNLVYFLRGSFKKLESQLKGLEEDFQAILDEDYEADSPGLENWAVSVGKTVTNHPEFQFCLTFCCESVRHVNVVLRLATSVQHVLLFERIDHFFDEKLASATPNSQLGLYQKIFTKLYHQSRDKLEESSKQSNHGMLNALKRVLLQELVNDGTSSSRGLVFVQKKLEAQLMRQWAANDDELKDCLNPLYITADAKDHTELLAKFSTGNCRLLFATSVIEEGIDVPDCKLVISYNKRVDHIQQLQQRGRARMHNGKYYVIASNRDTYDVALCNQTRHKLSEEAVSSVISRLNTESGREEFEERKLYEQKLAVEEYEKLLQKPPVSKHSESEHSFIFQCHTCQQHLFKSEQIFIFKDALRIVLSSDNENIFREKPHHSRAGGKAKNKFFTIHKVDHFKLLMCSNCGEYLGKKLKYGFCPLVTPDVSMYSITHDTNCPLCEQSGSFRDIPSRKVAKWKQTKDLFTPQVLMGSHVKRHYANLFTEGNQSTLDEIIGVEHSE